MNRYYDVDDGCGWGPGWARGMGGGRGHGDREARRGPRGRHVSDEDRGFFGRGPGRGGRGGGRVFGPGELRLVLLALLAKTPTNGYGLISEIEGRFGGAYAPSPGAVYPTLTLLEESGQIRAVDEVGQKRLYEVTEEGMAYLEENRNTVDAVMTRMAVAARAMAGGKAPRSVHEAFHTLMAAVRFHSRGWDEAEAERVRLIIEKAAKDVSDGGG